MIAARSSLGKSETPRERHERRMTLADNVLVLLRDRFGVEVAPERELRLVGNVPPCLVEVVEDYADEIACRAIIRALKARRVAG